MNEDKQPRHSYFPPGDPRRRRDADSPEAAFEQALIDCANAVDAGGNRVRLIPTRGVPTAQHLREATRDFANNMLDPGTAFITRDAVTSQLIESKLAEQVAWANLALLARATAAAIRYESSVALIPG